MKIRSRGLGKRELEMNLREFSVERDGTGVLLKGVTHAPITWETTVWVGPRDVGPVLRMALHLAMLRLGLGWILRRPDVPAEDHSGERMGQPAERAGQPAERGGQSAERAVRERGRHSAAAPAAAVRSTVGDPTELESEPAPVTPRSGSDAPDDVPASAPATPRASAPATPRAPAPTTPPAPATPRARPERLVRAQREPKPARPPRPPRQEQPTHPDMREREAVSAAGGPPTVQNGSADRNRKEH